MAHDFKDREIPDIEVAPTTDIAMRNSALRIAESTRKTVGQLSSRALMMRNRRHSGLQGPVNLTCPTATGTAHNVHDAVQTEVSATPGSSMPASSANSTTALHTHVLAEYPGKHSGEEKEKDPEPEAKPEKRTFAQRAWAWLKPFITPASLLSIIHI